jgi:hypothetical protein
VSEQRKVFQLFGETSASIFPLARDIMQAHFEEHFTEQRFYQPTFMAYNVSPEPISVDLFCKRTPYINPNAVDEFLAAAADESYLESDGAEGYLVSGKGTASINAVHNSFYDHINSINQFPEDKLKQLSELLGKIVNAVDNSDHLNDKVCFEISHGGHPDVGKGTLAQIDQHLDDLNAFRDDAHIAAWKPVGVSGHTWEVLSFVWNGNATTVEKLVEALPFRQFEPKDFLETLEDLVQRGWIDSKDDGYAVTEAGKKIRDDAEITTDTNYFKPWKTISDEELNQLGNLLEELKNTNIKLAEEIETK